MRYEYLSGRLRDEGTKAAGSSINAYNNLWGWFLSLGRVAKKISYIGKNDKIYEIYVNTNSLAQYIFRNEEFEKSEAQDRAKFLQQSYILFKKRGYDRQRITAIKRRINIIS